MENQWARTKLDLAVRLTALLGYSYQESAKIMSRHGHPGHTGLDIRKQIETHRPVVFEKITKARKHRKPTKICGVTAPPPQRIHDTPPDALVEFIKSAPAGLSIDEMCWKAICAGIRCNITDITNCRPRTNYEFIVPVYASIPYDLAIRRDLCLWPVGKGACGSNRQEMRYCGPHAARSRGGPGRQK